MLRRQFVSTFAKTKYNFIMQLIEQDGNSYIINSNQEQIVNRVLKEALSEIKSKFLELLETKDKTIS